jgi:hypothetical protein
MKLEIYTGREFSADFTVVSDDGVTGIVLDPSDSATLTISSNGYNPQVILNEVAMTIVDADNGLFNITLTPEQTELLDQKIGFEEDQYNTLSNYSGFIDFKLASGNRQAAIDLYVKGVGIWNPVA